MKVILKQDVENIGRKGDLVNVAPGYGRNYLLPRKLALVVTASNLKMIEIEQAALKKKVEQERQTFQSTIQKLNQVSLSFSRKSGEKDHIFGSVTAGDIKDALDAQGFEIDKKRIVLPEPLKRLGNYTVAIKVYHDDKAEIKVAGADGIHHALVVVPNLLQVFIIGVHVQADRFIGFPIRFEHAENEGVIEAAVDCHVQLAVFLMRDFHLRAAQLIPGVLHQALQLVMILSREQGNRLMPESAFQMVAHIREGIKIGAIHPDGISQAVMHSGSEAIWQAADAGARAHLDQSEGLGCLELFAQAGDADA